MRFRKTRARFFLVWQRKVTTHTVHSGAHQCPPAIYKYCIYTDIWLYTADKSLYLFTLVLLFLYTYIFCGYYSSFFLNIFSVCISCVCVLNCCCCVCAVCVCVSSVCCRIMLPGLLRQTPGSPTQTKADNARSTKIATNVGG